MKKIWFSLLLSLCLFCQSGTTSEASEELRIERAIIHILKKGVKAHKIDPCPAHPIVQNHEERERIAKAIKTASKAYNVPPMLLVATAFREGRFLNSSVGKIGERSTFQVVEQVEDFIKRIEPRCSLDSVEGSAFCAAAWMSRCRHICGDLKGAVVAYVTGKYCEAKNERLEWIANDRTKLAKYLDTL